MTKNKRVPRLSELAAKIEREWPDLTAVAEPGAGYCCTDRDIPGTRLRHPGKGRRGTLLTVRSRSDGALVYRHNAAETYRENDDVVRWMDRRRRGIREW